MKLLLLLFVLSFSINAETKFEMQEVFADAQAKQLAFDKFMSKDKKNGIEQLRAIDFKENLDEVLEIDSVNSSVDMEEDTYFCKVAFEFNKLRGQEKSVFRMRVKASSEDVGKEKIKTSCEKYASEYSPNKKSFCIFVKKKSSVCINPTRLESDNIERWNKSY